MTFQANPVAIPFGVAVAISGSLAVLAWRRRGMPTAPAFAAMMVGETAWALFEALELVIVDLPIKRLCIALRVAGAVTAVLGLLAFVLRYTGLNRWLEPRRFGAIVGPSLALAVLAWTNPWHHLYWAALENEEIGGFAIAMRAYGPGFWAHFAYSYALVAVATVLLARAAYRSGGVFRAQASIMLFGVLLPWVVNIIDMSQVFGYIHVDTVAMAFAVTGLAFWPGLVRFRLLDLTPVAWAAVVEGMNDSVVVIDPWGRTVELNPAAQRLVGRPARDLLGVEATRAFATWPALADRLDRIEEHQEASFELDGPESAPASLFDARISRLGDGVRPSGWVLVFRNITERRRAEEERVRGLREQGALNAVASAVSSSLELPEMLATLQGVMAGQFGIPGGAVFFYDEVEDRLELEAAWGLPQAMLESFRAVSVSGSQDERVVREKEVFLSPDLREIAPFTTLGLDVSRPGWQGYLSVPLVAKGEVQGILSLFGAAPDAFGDDQIAFFKTVGQEVGIAIHNARLFEQVSAGHERLQALSRRLVEVQETERRHVARELHDEIGQDLTGLKIALAMAARAPAENRGAVLDQAQELVDRLMTRVRELSLDLRPTMLDDLGLLPALLWHFERYTAQTGIRVDFEHAGLAARFPPPVETAAYRIVQEALTNVARHAGVGEATVRLWANPEVLSLQIIDRGIGFDPEAASVGSTSSGLSGMGERASLLGGQLRVESSPRAGTRLTAELPLAGPAGGNGERL